MSLSTAKFGQSLVLILAASTGILGQDAATTAAQKAESAWLALVDLAEYDASWKIAATAFRTAVTEPLWEQAMKSARAPLGDVISRKLQSATFTKTVSGAPDGSYVIAVFQTSFKNKAAATETVTAVLDRDSAWNVAGYFIR